MGNIYISGGGAGKAFAIIHVEYPSGSVCTCTNAATGKVLRSNDTSGLWNALLPEGGNWIVECHTADSAKTKSFTVTGIEQYQIVFVRLAYELIAYDHGDENTSITGGFTSSGSVSLDKNADFMSLSLSMPIYQYPQGSLRTSNKISLTGYSKITVNAKTNWSNSSDMSSYRIAVMNDVDTVAYADIPHNKTAGDHTLNISLSGDYYIGITGSGHYPGGAGGITPWSQIDVYSIIIE